MDKSDVGGELERLVPSLEDLELLARPVFDSERRGHASGGRAAPIEARTVCGRGVQLREEAWRSMPPPAGDASVARALVGRRLLLYKDRQLVEQTMVLFNYVDDRYEWWAGRNGLGSTSPITWEQALEGWLAEELAGALAQLLEQVRERRLRTVDSLERRRQAALLLRARLHDARTASAAPGPPDSPRLQLGCHGSRRVAGGLVTMSYTA